MADKNKSKYTHPRKRAFSRKRPMQDDNWKGDTPFQIAMARMVIAAQRDTVGAGDKARAMMSVGLANAILNRAETKFFGGK